MKFHVIFGNNSCNFTTLLLEKQVKKFYENPGRKDKKNSRNKL